MSSGYDPVLYGNFLLIDGAGEARTYFYSHLRRPPSVDHGRPIDPAPILRRWERLS